jgi:hypothetical protein
LPGYWLSAIGYSNEHKASSSRHQLRQFGQETGGSHK